MAASPTTKPAHLDPSPLGTKEYWDNLYTTEITNYAEDPTDEGTIWFDDSAAEDKVVEFLEEKIENEKILGEGIAKENCSFLDLGTGNGHFLFRLREGEGEKDEEEGGGGWEGRMLGVDYSERSVEFARRIGEEKKKEKEKEAGLSKEVEFKWWDLMTEAPTGTVLEGEQAAGWDVVLDKGTFDAISLSEEKDSRGRRLVEGYRERVIPLVRGGGLLLITSCNWTEEELNAWFVGEDRELEVVDKIQYRSFSFGGKKGQTISSICFRKRASV